MSHLFKVMSNLFLKFMSNLIIHNYFFVYLFISTNKRDMKFDVLFTPYPIISVLISYLPPLMFFHNIKSI